MKKVISLLLCLVIAIPMAACQPSGDVTAKKDTEIEFWSTYASEKVLSNEKVEKYADVKKAAVIEVDMAKNEEETAQLLMTAKTDILSYDVTVSDLTCGENVYDSSNITVYNQKYIEIKEIYNKQDGVLPTGYYPDALLPFEVAKEYGENTIQAGRNQGVTFVFHVPADFEAGLYQGNFTVNYDGKSESIPVKLNIRDFAVSETTHAKTYYGISVTGSLPYGEMDIDPELKNVYQNELAKYRLCGGVWYIEEDTPEAWIDYVWDFIKNPRNSTLAVPWKYVHEGVTIDRNYTREHLIAFGKKCLEEGVNLVDKLLAYYTVIDEPDLAGLTKAHIQSVMDNCNAQYEEAAQAIEAMQGDATLKAEIAASLRDIETLLTVGSYYTEYEDIVGTWCPKTQNYDHDTFRESFMAAEGEKWWYTCADVPYPYSSYLIEAEGYFPRLLDWQAEMYGVTGYLFWDVAYYQNADGSHIEDCYQNPDRCLANGDGFLFYPGKPYGMDTPVGSIRLQTARDGIEDKEVLLAIRNGYAALSEASGYAFSADTLLNSFYEQLFNKMKILTTAEIFYKVRSQVLDFAELLESEYKFAVSNIKNNGNDVTYEVVAAASSTLKDADGKILQAKATYGSDENAIKVYEVKGSKLTANSIELVLENANGSKKVSLPLGGASTTISVSDLVKQVDVFYGEVAQVNDFLDVTFENSDSNKTQRFTIAGDFLSMIGKDTDWISVVLKSNSVVKYSICLEYEKMNSYYEIAQGTLSGSGAETIKIRNVYSLPANSGKIKKIHIYIGEKGDRARKVSLGEITIAVLG